MTSADGSGYRTRRGKSRSSVQAGSAGAGNGTQAVWAAVRFNEESRAFNTGNVVKLIGQEEWTEAYKKIRNVQTAERRYSRTKGVKGGNVCAGTGLPSGKDLDVVAEEERIKWLTRG